MFISLRFIFFEFKLFIVMNQDEATNSLYDILTRREIEVLILIVNGFKDKEIADHLNIGFHTARTHHKNIRRKTEQKNISRLMKFALNTGLNIEMNQ